MNGSPLDNLVRIGQLKTEPPDIDELKGLIHSGRVRLIDAKRTSNSLESRFDLAYNAAHAMALAALRWHGYRSENRYQVFHIHWNWRRNSGVYLIRPTANATWPNTKAFWRLTTTC